MSDVHPDETQEHRDQFDRMMRDDADRYRDTIGMLDLDIEKFHEVPELVAAMREHRDTAARCLADTEAYLAGRP